jgi:serine/threonine-protein kinase SRK2
MPRAYTSLTQDVESFLKCSPALSDHCVDSQVFLTKEYLAIAMEYAAGGDMFQYVKHRGGLEEVEARWFFQQLIIGMDYCHKMVRVQ